MPADDTSSQPPRFSTLPLFQREVALVLVLCVVSAGLFAATRSMATWQRANQVRDAARWYQRGTRALDAGRLEDGIANLRRAVGGDRGNPIYALALARALAGDGRDEEATQLLLRLRELHPDDSEINLRLARLAARGGRSDEAVRFYNHALYGIATLGADRDRWSIRLELARHLLNEGQRDAALIELSALAREMPDDPASHLEVAALFERAGDLRQARTQYEAAAALAPKSWTALVGAGEASFALGDYAGAERALQAAGEAGTLTAQQQQHLETARRVQAVDPLATKLAMSQRVSRLTAGLDRAATRLDQCKPADPTGGRATAPADDPLRAELKAFASQPGAALRDTDVVGRGVDLLARVSAEVERRCGEHNPADEAWILIGRMHREGARE